MAEVPVAHAREPLVGSGPQRVGHAAQRLVLALRTTHAITHWWEQILLLGYNRIDFQFLDADNGSPIDFGDFDSDSLEQRLLLNYYWNMSLPEFYQVATT